MPFDEYAKLPGISHSDIRNDGKPAFVPTKKMNLGTDVHNYLLDPKSYRHNNKEVVAPIAVKLKEVVGDLWQYLEHEMAVTADFSHNGFCLPFRGRIDSGIRKKIVIDYKIINGASVKSTLGFFHYDTQTSGYASSIEAPLSILLAYSTKTKKVEVENIPVRTEWWDYQIIQRGKAII